MPAGCLVARSALLLAGSLVQQALHANRASLFMLLAGSMK